MNGPFHGKVAVVTGGGSGIGKAAALRLARDGAFVVGGDLRFSEETRQQLSAAGILATTCDMRVECQVEQLIQLAIDRAGGLDILVNSAGIIFVRQIPDVTEAEWDACLDTNLKGAFLASKHAIPHLRNRGGGSIVNISSNAGLLPRAHDPVYSTSKGALNAFTRSLALSHSRDRIRVNAVCPGPVGDTHIMNDELDAAVDRQAVHDRIVNASPLCRAFGRMITPEEVADAVAYLVSDGAMMVTGTLLSIDGGKSLGVPPA
jgi:NAD(P)-dependent dehydrogenase (short-subunit alcohol dehydrogenase family)